MDTEDVDALTSDSEDDTGEEQKLSGEIQKLILEVLFLFVMGTYESLSSCGMMYWSHGD